MVRLLNINTLQLHEFTGGSTPPYVIASHRWGENESTFQDVRLGQNEDTPGFHKIQAFCDKIRSMPGSEKFPWLWIDTCCIEKSSSAELAEAINSMFRWYTDSYFCLAYLHDVSVQKGAVSLKSSNWFTRGWTLQELLAPHIVIFLDREWQTLGHKHHTNPKRLPDELHCGLSLNQLLSRTTGIPEEILLNYELSATISNEEKQAWLKDRSTTRPEDMAYCMLGIFHVSMPPIYGEGKSRSWRRLYLELRRQEEGKGESSDEAEAPYRKLIDVRLPGRKRYTMTSKPRTEVTETQSVDNHNLLRSDLERLQTEITALKKQLEDRVDDELRTALRLALAKIQDREDNQSRPSDGVMFSKSKAASGSRFALPWISRKTYEAIQVKYENALADAARARHESEKDKRELEKQLVYSKPMPDLQKEPIKFLDAVGRKFTFPWHICKAWKGMESLIKQAFLHVDVIGDHVHQGHYDLTGPDGEIILPQVWDVMIEPGWTITMHLWPMQEEDTRETIDALDALSSARLSDRSSVRTSSVHTTSSHSKYAHASLHQGSSHADEVADPGLRDVRDDDETSLHARLKEPSEKQQPRELF